MKNIINYLILILLISSSCKKLVEVEPPISNITSEVSFKEDATAIAAVNGFYSTIMSSPTNQTVLWGFQLFTGISSDELKIPSTLATVLYAHSFRNVLTSQTSNVLWRTNFGLLYQVNNAILQLDRTQTLSPAVKQQLLGECYFMRAYCYFHFVNLYGDVPLLLTPDYVKNSTAERTPVLEVYSQIVADLLEAKKMLSGNFLDATLLATSTERVRPTKWAASALLARTYLYIGSLGNSEMWTKAELESSEVISSSLFDMPNVKLNEVFLKNSKEAIWQLQPVQTGFNTPEGREFVLTSRGPQASTALKPFHLNSPLVNSFETGDPRRAEWVGTVTASGVTYYYALKYKVGQAIDATITSTGAMKEYSMALRLAEQYLIRAEAKAEQGKLTGANGAIADLNVIRTRARGTNASTILPNLSESLTKQQVIEAILHERQVELFTEGCHRWFDLKRRGKIDEVMTNIAGTKNSTWNSYQQLYPIPLTEIQSNPNLKQNPGYF